MNVREIMLKYLKDNGYDGLYSDECGGCGCNLESLMVCQDDLFTHARDCSQCSLGHYYTLDMLEPGTDAYECVSDGNWWIGKPKHCRLCGCDEDKDNPFATITLCGHCFDEGDNDFSDESEAKE